MNLLLDANLSWRLTSILKKHFGDCLHVDRIGISVPATDMEIWDFAAEKLYVIVTNDEDFLDLLSLKGAPPKVILLRTGNQSNKNVVDILIKHKEDILQLSKSKEYDLLEIF